MKKTSILLAVLILIPALAGCNTIKGIGQDLAGIGNGLSGASDKVKDDITRERN